MDLFKNWIPNIGVKIILFFLLLPNLVMFFLPVANEEMAASYYGLEVNDIQFMISLYYVGFASFYILERRFYAYMTSKQYFVVFQILQLICCYLLYSNQNIIILFAVRFFQGMLFASAVNLYMTLVMKTMKTHRAKEITFSIFFGMLLCTGSLNNLITADILDHFNFGIVYQCCIIGFAICILTVLICMHNHLNTRSKPLIYLDLPSFFLLSICLFCFGYLSIYGQQYYWLENKKILQVTGLSVLCAVLFLLRQFQKKRPYINLDIFKYKQFLWGIALLFFMYIERFSFTFSGSFFTKILNMDPRHVSYMYALNLLGIATGVTFAAWWLIKRKSTVLLWFLGFSSLIIYHSIMIFLMSGSGNLSTYAIPMFCHGLGIGLIMVPTILHCIGAVPYYLIPSTAAFCLVVRFAGYTTSTILTKYFALFYTQTHYNRFLQSVTDNNSFYHVRLEQIKLLLANNGLEKNTQNQMSLKIIHQMLDKQILMRSIMDYYNLMLALSIFVLISISIYWFRNKNYKLNFRIFSPI